jgi:signal transduction histidine kinase
LSIKELYEAEKREQQIASQKTELNRKNIIQVILIGVLIIAVIFTFVFRSMYQNKNRANAEILRQQQTLENQALEIELANTTLHERNFLLEELDREKNEFLGIAAHDLKNPLASMRLNVSMLQRYGNRFTAEEQSASLQNMLTVIERMTAIITNLLDINALERGGMQFTILSFDIAPVVEAAVHQYRLPAEAKQLTLHFSQETPDNIVSADKQALMQVLDNLVSNAVKYSPHGKHVFVRILRNASAVRVEVQDEGEGISQEDMKKLFGKFARLSAQPSGGEHSTGLGLSIVKRMVEAMNGRVWCESELGKGATFIVELPIQSNLLNQVSSRIIS